MRLSFTKHSCALLFAIVSNLNGLVMSQNIGVGTPTPTAPLSFGLLTNGLGQKLVINANGNVPSFGIGSFDGGNMEMRFGEGGTVAFGWGNSSSFTEALRVTSDQQVGIGVTNPMLNLDVRSRIRIRGNAFGNAGIWSEALPADYQPSDPPEYLSRYYLGMLDNGSVGFRTLTTEVMRYKGDTKSLGFNGSYGTAGQVLTSNGDNAPPTWKTLNGNIPYNSSVEYFEISSYTLTNAAPLANMTGLSPSLSFSQNTLMRVELNLVVQTPSCLGCGISTFEINMPGKTYFQSLPNGRTQTINLSSLINLGTASNFFISVNKTSGPNIVLPATAGRLSSLGLWAYSKH
jgi:hypothetical protein